MFPRLLKLPKLLLIETLKTAIFKTLALKLATELNTGTVSSTTRHSLFKILYNTFLLSSKKTTYEQYYRLHLPAPKIAICEITSPNVFVSDGTAFEQGNFSFLPALHEALYAFNNVLQEFGFSQTLEQ